MRVHPLGQVSIKPGLQHVAKKIGNTASLLPISKSGVISLPQMHEAHHTIYLHSFINTY